MAKKYNFGKKKQKMSKADAKKAAKAKANVDPKTGKKLPPWLVKKNSK